MREAGGLAALRACAGAIAIAVALEGCGNVIVGTAGTARTVPVRVRGTPPEASVTLDDQRVGSLALVAARGMRVPPGRHRVSVEAPGYLPFDHVVEAKDEVVTVDVSLVPIPD